MEQQFDRKDLAALFIGFGLVAAVAIFFSARYFSTDDPAAASLEETEEVSTENVPSISFEDARKKYLFGNASTIIDIRPEESFAAFHIPDSLSLPVGKLSSYSFAENADLIIISDGMDGTIRQANEILKGKRLGYAFLSGGIDFWVGNGAPVVTIGNPASYLDRSKVRLVPAEEWKKSLDPTEDLAAPFILDVRRKELFDRSHLADAYNIPLAELEKRRKEIPPATAVALYGETDLEAFQAAVRLFDFGFFAVQTLEVGYSDLDTTK